MRVLSKRIGTTAFLTTSIFSSFCSQTSYAYKGKYVAQAYKICKESLNSVENNFDFALKNALLKFLNSNKKFSFDEARTILQTILQFSSLNDDSKIAIVESFYTNMLDTEELEDNELNSARWYVPINLLVKVNWIKDSINAPRRVKKLSEEDFSLEYDVFEMVIDFLKSNSNERLEKAKNIKNCIVYKICGMVFDFLASNGNKRLEKANKIKKYVEGLANNKILETLLNRIFRGGDQLFIGDLIGAALNKKEISKYEDDYLNFYSKSGQESMKFAHELLPNSRWDFRTENFYEKILLMVIKEYENIEKFFDVICVDVAEKDKFKAGMKSIKAAIESKKNELDSRIRDFDFKAFDEYKKFCYEKISELKSMIQDKDLIEKVFAGMKKTLIYLYQYSNKDGIGDISNEKIDLARYLIENTKKSYEGFGELLNTKIGNYDGVIDFFTNLCKSGYKLKKESLLRKYNNLSEFMNNLPTDLKHKRQFNTMFFEAKRNLECTENELNKKNNNLNIDDIYKYKQMIKYQFENIDEAFYNNEYMKELFNAIYHNLNNCYQYLFFYNNEYEKDTKKKLVSAMEKAIGLINRSNRDRSSFNDLLKEKFNGEFGIVNFINSLNRKINLINQKNK